MRENGRGEERGRERERERRGRETEGGREAVADLGIQGGRLPLPLTKS